MTFCSSFQYVRRQTRPAVTGELRGIVAEGKPKRTGGWGRTVAIQLLILIVTLGVADDRPARHRSALSARAPRRRRPDLQLRCRAWLVSGAQLRRHRSLASAPSSVRHNSLGLRDIEHDAAPKPTIAFIGDSFVWGYDVGAERALHRSAAPQDARPADRQRRCDLDSPIRNCCCCCGCGNGSSRTLWC